MSKTGRLLLWGTLVLALLAPLDLHGDRRLPPLRSEQVFAVHATHYLPSDGILRAGAALATKYAPGEKPKQSPIGRATHHWSLGELRQPYAAGNLTTEERPFAVVMPVAALKPQLINASLQDTIALGDVMLPANAVVIAPTSYKGELPSGVVIQRYEQGKTSLRKAVEQVITSRGGVVLDATGDRPGSRLRANGRYYSQRHVLRNLLADNPGVSRGTALFSQKGRAYWFGVSDHLQILLKSYAAQEQPLSDRQLALIQAMLGRAMSKTQRMAKRRGLPEGARAAYGRARLFMNAWYRMVAIDLQTRQATGRRLTPSAYDKLINNFLNGGRKPSKKKIAALETVPIEPARSSDRDFFVNHLSWLPRKEAQQVVKQIGGADELDHLDWLRQDQFYALNSDRSKGPGLEALTLIRKHGRSGAYYRNENGVVWYLKPDEKHAELQTSAEVIGAQIYRSFGYRVPETHITYVDGKRYAASRSFGRAGRSPIVHGLGDASFRQIRVVAAFLKDWDRARPDLDDASWRNIVRIKGRDWLFDFGGSLGSRAQGEYKPGSRVSEAIGAFEATDNFQSIMKSLDLDHPVNPHASDHPFRQLTRADAIALLPKFQALTDRRIEEIVVSARYSSRADESYMVKALKMRRDGIIKGLTALQRSPAGLLDGAAFD